MEQMIFSKQLFSENGNYAEQLDVSGLSDGIYILLFKTVNGTNQKKFVNE